MSAVFSAIPYLIVCMLKSLMYFMIGVAFELEGRDCIFIYDCCRYMLIIPFFLPFKNAFISSVDVCKPFYCLRWPQVNV